MNFRAKFEVLLQNTFGQPSRLTSLEIRLFYRNLDSRKRRNLLGLFYRNYPICSNGQRKQQTRIKIEGERNTGFPAITAPRLQTIKQTLTTKHSIEFTYSDFPCHLKVNWDKLASSYRRGKCKKGKRLTITANFQERNSKVQRWAGKKIRLVGRIVKSWTAHERVISQLDSRL